ncbi:PREDICTED: cadherin-17 [Elephantulus edwardii]|uniref:cadherin-17 n=1 Tax=Elephantulus edwardii TaxID=28737 RepID=UPI0003F0D33C|nr:PREDICTED: cadherin-17 [Elephantulus edwardii]
MPEKIGLVGVEIPERMISSKVEEAYTANTTASWMKFLLTGYCQEGKFSGQLKPMTLSVYEGQEPSQLVFQFKAKPPAVNFKLTGETYGIFEIQTDGYLYYTQALDRETKAVYNLQVEALDANGVTVEGPVIVTIEVKDINDNRPTFLQPKYEGSVRQHSRPGKPFLYVNATDLDDPATPNGQLSYQILIQLPKINNAMYFQIDQKTGGISLTPEGSREIDPVKNPSYNLVVLVADMDGQSENSFSDTTSVDIFVKENIWKAPETVKIEENSTESHPIKITQVQWNEPGAQYSLVELEKLPRFPFSIDQEGIIYVTHPLDREEKDAYVFNAVVKDEFGKPLAWPLRIHVEVQDINDNPPTCPSAVTVFEVQENERISSNIGTFTAHDMDEENTLSSILKYSIFGQTPNIPKDGLFMVSSHTGVLQLAKQSLKKQDSPQYNLTVRVSDSDFTTLCLVQINVIDINDEIPIFQKSNYGNLTLAEDTRVGTTILTIQATDADEPFTGSSKILYRIIEGDSEGRLEIDTDPSTNAGYVKIKKPLDFETTPVHNIVFKAENPEPLVSGIQYNDSSFATLRLIVTDVNEPPLFSQQMFQAKVFENVTIGTYLGNVTAKDPEGLEISYSLKDDRRGWLRINSATGEIFSAAALDREAESNYEVHVEATEKDGLLKSSASFYLTLDDVNDNAPRLAKEYTGLFFCYPLRTSESIIFEATDDDRQPLLGPQFTFDLGSDSVRNDWDISRINGTHAKLSPKHISFEERLYHVPIRIGDRGRPPMERTVSLPVTFCTCVDGHCFRPAGGQSGIPTVGMAVGIILATLLIIGAILTAVFIRLKRKEKANAQKAQSIEARPLAS